MVPLREGTHGASKRSCTISRQRCCSAVRALGSLCCACCALQAATATAAADRLLPSFAVLSAPIAIRALTVSKRMRLQAMCSTLLPLQSRAFNVSHAHDEIAAIVASEQPRVTATCNTVLPLQSTARNRCAHGSNLASEGGGCETRTWLQQATRTRFDWCAAATWRMLLRAHGERLQMTG